MSGAGSGFEVHPSALAAFAATSDQRQQAFDQCEAKAGQLTVSQDAFGHIPGIGARVFHAYQNHVQQCTLGISSAAEAMASVSNGIRATILGYRAADTSAEDNALAVEWETSNIGIQEPS